MSTQLAMDEFSPMSKGQSSYDLALALGMKTLPSSSSFYAHGGLDVYIPHTYPHRDLLNNSTHNIAYPYLNETHNGFLPDLSIYDSQLQTMPPSQFAMRPTSPNSFYPPQNWAENLSQFAPRPPANPLLQNMSMFASSSSAQPSRIPDQAPGAQPAWALSGSLDPATGVFQRTPEHPRLRTAQACEKCRIRKAKCSGDHPSCQRCISRGLLCEYAPERKMRGPNKTKRKGTAAAAGASAEARGPSPAGSASGRRMSIASSSSGSDEMGAGLEIPPAVAAARPPHIPEEPVEPSPSHQHLTLPNHFVDAQMHYDPQIDPLLQDPAQHQPVSHQRRPRPPPLNLGNNHLFPSMHGFPPFDGADAVHGPSFHHDVAADFAQTRRGSLPDYIVDHFSPNDGASAYSVPRSNSTSEGSMYTPATPSSLPSFDDFVLEYRSFSGEDLHTVKDVPEDTEQWAAAHPGSDADETPRIGMDNSLVVKQDAEE